MGMGGEVRRVPAAPSVKARQQPGASRSARTALAPTVTRTSFEKS
jgi:hypothetical protein